MGKRLTIPSCSEMKAMSMKKLEKPLASACWETRAISMGPEKLRTDILRWMIFLKASKVRNISRPASWMLFSTAATRP